MECTLIQSGNEDYISLAFSEPFLDRVIKPFRPDELPDELAPIRDRLEYVSHGCEVAFNTSTITLRKHGNVWRYFLPNVIAYLRDWRGPFPLYFKDERREFEYEDSDCSYETKRVKVTLIPIDYGLQFDTIPVTTEEA